VKEVKSNVGLIVNFLNGPSSRWNFFLFHSEKMAFFIAQATTVNMSMTLEVDSEGGTIAKQHKSR
jgi:hypothetical protein